MCLLSAANRSLHIQDDKIFYGQVNRSSREHSMILHSKKRWDYGFHCVLVLCNQVKCLWRYSEFITTAGRSVRACVIWELSRSSSFDLRPLIFNVIVIFIAF